MKKSNNVNYPNSNIDIVLLSCNRVKDTKKTIDRLYNSVKYPDKIRLIVVDNESVDGTYKYLEEEKKNGRVKVLETCSSDKPITFAYNKGFEHVESELFLMMQDDIDIPDLEPEDIIEQLISLIKKYPKAGSIGCRIQRIPNMNWSAGDENIVPARKSASAYFRIQSKNDYIKMGRLNGRRDWDDINFCSRMRGIGKECYWAKNLWCSHDRGYREDRGYKIKPRRWGTGIHSRTKQAYIEKPYPIVDPKTNIPLEIVNKDKKVNVVIKPDKDFWGTKMRVRLEFYDLLILKQELNPDKNTYRIPNNADIIIDIGAHIGGTSIRAVKMGARKVFAFEPELFNYETLLYNVRRNKMREQIVCINQGIGKPGRTKLYTHEKMSGTVSSYLNQKGFKEDNFQIASFISIHEVFEKYNINHCDLLKIDNEGSEYDIIKSFDDKLANKVNQISLEFHDRRASWNKQELINILSKWYNPESITREEWVFRRKNYEKK